MDIQDSIDFDARWSSAEDYTVFVGGKQVIDYTLPNAMQTRLRIGGVKQGATMLKSWTLGQLKIDLTGGIGQCTVPSIKVVKPW